MRQTLRLLLPLGLLAALLGLAVGCDSGNENFLTPERLNNGLVIILPGIEGESEFNHEIRRGLAAGGVFRAMPIHSWGRPIPLAGVFINQVDFLGNRLSGGTVARMIMTYQDSNPGRPVHIIGHSGGGGVAVFAAEALPDDRQIDGLVLLSASISSAYDLTKAASHCRKGIVNFYNPQDTGILGVGTTVMGTVDGTHGPSAGLIGFDRAGTRGNEKVFQVKIAGIDAMGDPHLAATEPGFVSAHVAPWVLAKTWPAGAVFAQAPADASPAEPPRTAAAAGKAGQRIASAGKPASPAPPPAASPADAATLFDDLIGAAGPGDGAPPPPPPPPPPRGAPRRCGHPLRRPDRRRGARRWRPAAGPHRPTHAVGAARRGDPRRPTAVHLPHYFPIRTPFLRAFRPAPPSGSGGGQGPHLQVSAQGPAGHQADRTDH